MRIMLITSDPGARQDLTARAERLDRTRLRPGTTLTLTGTRAGIRRSGTPYDHSLADLVTLDAGMSAQDEGYDAVCIDDPSDPALDALRSRLDIPITGATSGALWMARLVGLPLAYLVPESEVAGIEHILWDVDQRTAFVTAFTAGPETSEASLAEAVVEAARRAVHVGAACLALVGVAELFRERVSAAVGLPVFGATMAALKLAEVMVGLGLSQSRVTYGPAREVQDGLIAKAIRPDGFSSSVASTASVDGAAKRRVKVLVPHSDMDEAAVGRRSEVITPGLLHADTKVDYSGIETSPNRADSPYATLLMDLFCLKAGISAAEAGFDAITVDSTSDSGIPGLRSRLPILVLGTGRATWALAAALSSRFSILAMEPEWNYFYRKNLKAARLSSALASVRSVGTPTDPYNLFAGKEDEMYRILTDLGRSAIDEDGAEAIVVGSTTMHQAGDHLAAELPVPVLNPGRVALRSIEAMLEMDLVQSRSVASLHDRAADEIFA